MPPTTPEAAPKPFDLGAIPGNLAAGGAELIGAIPSGIPTGWLPGGADEQFSQMGNWMKANDPASYKTWQTVNAAAGSGLLGQFFGGGNLKSDFVRQWGTYYADRTKNGLGGIGALNPSLGWGPAGSLGGALADALNLAAIPGLAVQRTIAGNRTPMTETPTRSGMQVTGGDRVAQIMAKAQSNPADLTNVEKAVVANVGDGSWTRDHALDFIVSHGEGLSDNGLLQMVGSVGTDPVTWATLGSAGLLKLGEVGAAAEEATAGTSAARAVELAAGAEKGAPTAEGLSALNASVGATTAGTPVPLSNIDRLGMVVHSVQQSNLAPVFRAARFSIDPFGVMPKSAITDGIKDLAAGAATDAIRRTYGESAIHAAFDRAENAGVVSELRTALGSYAANIARKYSVINARAAALRAGLPEQLLDTTPDSVVGNLMRTASKDSVDRITDYASRVKFAVIDDEQLASRLSSAFGGMTKEEWGQQVAKMSDDEKSLWHAATYTQTYAHFLDAVNQVSRSSAGKLDLNRLEVLNEGILDKVSARALLDKMSAAPEVTQKAAIWNAAADRYAALAALGHATPNGITIDRLVNRLGEMISSGMLHARVTPEEVKNLPAALREFLDQHPDWNLGFRPTDEQAWGLQRNADGLLTQSYEPFVSNVANGVAAPMTQPASDTLRNLIGQVVGKGSAGALNRPFDSIEIAMRTARDQISGQRLMANVGQRLGKNLATYGVGKADAQRIWGAIQDMAHTQRSQIAGLSAENIWSATGDLVKGLPDDVRARLGPREMMNATLDAASGDMRIVGLSSGFTQRMRAFLAQSGLPLVGDTNRVGQLTSRFYNDVRYGAFNPTFRLQAASDAAYFNILHGVMPVGTGELTGRLAEAQAILNRIGDTALAPSFALERPEYTAIVDFRDALNDELARTPGLLQRLLHASGQFGQSAESRFIRNNMIAQSYAHFGDAVRSALDAAAKVTGEDGEVVRSFADLRAQYSAAAGRILDDNEVGLRYIQEMFDDALDAKTLSDGTLDYSNLITKGEWFTPADFGEIRPVDVQGWMRRLGYPNMQALRQDVGPYGTRGIQWLREELGRTYNVPKQYADRLANALTFDWNAFWSDTNAALGLSAGDSEKLQTLIARYAQARKMTPSEYLGQVMKTNIGAAMDASGNADLTAQVGKMLALVKSSATAGSDAQKLRQLAELFQPHLDLSAQKALVQAFRADLPEQIRAAETAGDAARVADLRAIAASMKSGDAAWAFADAVARRASGEALANPDVERAVQFFRTWVDAAGETAKGDAQSLTGRYVRELLHDVPTDNAYAYNRTEGLIRSLLVDRLRLAQKDAFRLAYAQTSRSVFERTLNHPFFGIYPSSYMWFKVLPEMVRFMAKEPFGLETSAAALTAAHVQESLAAQREYDPEFSTMADQIGNSKTAFLLSYLVPSLPWDEMRAAVPPWVSAAAKHGPDIGAMSEAEFKTIDPRRWVSYFGAAGNEMLRGATNELQGATQPAQPTTPGIVSLAQSLAPGGALGAVPAQPTPGTPSLDAQLKQPVSATQLSPILSAEMQQLHDMLATAYAKP